jgi:excisionase family DNA binding protein
LPEYLTEKEAAEILKVSPYTLAKLRKEGNGPPYVKIGGSIRYIKETIQEWVKAQERRRG